MQISELLSWQSPGDSATSREEQKQPAPSENKQRAYDLERYRKELKMLRNPRCFAEIKILACLDSFENTREDDLVSYLTQLLKRTETYVRKTIKGMVNEDKIRQIVHNKLDPTPVYYESPRFLLTHDYSLGLLDSIDAMGNLEKYRKAIKSELMKGSKNKP